jgi:streptogramin lyase
LHFSTRQLSGCLLLAAAAAASGAFAQPAAPSAPASHPQQATRPQPRGSAEDCRMRRAEYQRSQACYEQYRTVNGMRPEAFARCGPELPDPSAECGAPSTP